LFCCLIVAVQAHPIAQASGSTLTPLPLGMPSKWFLDSSASFHMTPDSTHLSSISPPTSPFVVQTADDSLSYCWTWHSFYFILSCSFCFAHS
jgi:hypothetical protein